MCACTCPGALCVARRVVCVCIKERVQAWSGGQEGARTFPHAARALRIMEPDSAHAAPRLRCAVEAATEKVRPTQAHTETHGAVARTHTRSRRTGVPPRQMCAALHCIRARGCRGRMPPVPAPRRPPTSRPARLPPPPHPPRAPPPRRMPSRVTDHCRLGYRTTRTRARERRPPVHPLFPPHHARLPVVHRLCSFGAS